MPGAQPRSGILRGSLSVGRDPRFSGQAQRGDRDFQPPVRGVAPQVADIWLKLGQAQEAVGKHAEALASCQRAAPRQSRQSEIFSWQLRRGGRRRSAEPEGGAVLPSVAAADLPRRAALAAVPPTFPRGTSSGHCTQCGVQDTSASDRRAAVGQRVLSRLSGHGRQGPNKDVSEISSRTWPGAHCRSFSKNPTAIDGWAAPARRLRVALFHRYTVSYYFNEWITHGDQDRFETFVYHINPIIDKEGRSLAASCDHYRPESGSIAAIASIICSG